MKNLILLVMFMLAAMMLASCCPASNEELAWEEGFRDMEWSEEDDDIDDLEVYCRTIHMIRYHREGDDLLIGPAEETGNMVPLYRLLYGFCDHEFYEVAMFAEGKFRDDLVAIFTDNLGEPTCRKGDLVKWEKGNVSARVRTAPQFFEKVEGRLTFKPLARKCRRYHKQLKMVWDTSPDAEG